MLTGDRHRAEDLLQVALRRVRQRWFVIRESPGGYAHKVVVNVSRDRRRTLRRRPTEFAQPDWWDASAVDEAERLLERDTVTYALRRLPRRQREVLALRFFLALSVAETATALETSEGAVKAYAARGLVRLRRLFVGPVAEQGNDEEREVRDAQ